MSNQVSTIRAGSPLYLVTSTQRCHCCTRDAEVIALAARYIWDDHGDPEEPDLDIEACMLTLVQRMPREIQEELTHSHPRFQMGRSVVFQTECFANRCECGAWFENFDLHHEPGGAFFPRYPQETRRMTVRTLPFTGYHEFKSNYAWGPGLFTFALARRIPHSG